MCGGGGGSVDTEVKVPSAVCLLGGGVLWTQKLRSPQLSEFLCFKFSVGQNIALCALPGIFQH